MKAYLRYAAIILTCVVALVVLFRFKNCGEGRVQPGTVSVPADTNFAPVSNQVYQPPSLPFSRKSSGVNLPAGVKEKDVKRIITLEVRDVPKEPPKKIDVVETKSGETFVMKDSSIISVTVTEFVPPVVQLQLKFAVGMSIGKSGSGLRLSPAGIFAPVEWAGWIHAPIVMDDLDGIGVGCQVKVYHEIFIGAAKVWRYDLGSQAKIFLTYII